MAWKKVKISYFLKERLDRIKPDAANETGLNRLEKINFSGKIFINENKPTRTGMILVKKGDLVISGINVEKGALAVYQGDEDLLATIHYSSYSYNKTKIDIEFLKWFLKSDAFKEALLSQTKGGIKSELKPKKFLPLEIDLPDLKTQIEIRNKLNSVNDEINEVVDIQNDNDNYLTKLRQSILSEAIQGKLVLQDSSNEPVSILLEQIKVEKEKLIKEKKIRKEKPLPKIKEEEIPYELPRGWDWCRMGDVFDIYTGNSISATVKELKYTTLQEGHNYISTKDVRFNGTVNYETGIKIPFNEIKFKIAKVESTLICIEGGSAGRKIAKITENLCFGNKLCSIYPILINSNYSNYYLNSNIFSTFFFSKMNGIIGGVGVNKIKQIIIPLPPLSEQKRIVAKVDQLMKLCDELEVQVKENQKNSKSLMNTVLREAFEQKKDILAGN